MARRKEVRCYQCDSLMTGLQLTYVEYAEWPVEERAAFIADWLEKNKLKQEELALKEELKAAELDGACEEDEEI